MSSTQQKNNQPRIFVLVIMIICTVAILANFISSTNEAIPEIRYFEFKKLVEEPRNSQEQIVEAIFQDNYLTGIKTDKTAVRTYVPNDESVRRYLEEKGIELSFREPESDNLLKGILINIIPMIIILGFLFLIMRSVQAGGGKAMSFGRSRAKLISDSKPKITFADIAGIDEAKQELQEIIEFLKEPKKFTKLGGRIPKGVLLIGPPGTGKTILAKGVAGEAKVPFFSISGSDFVEMFVGVGASRVRDLFEQAKKNSPCIIFIDEIDAVGRHRGAGLGGGHDEREQTLNQLLVEMDGFEANEGVIIVAATNRADVLDPALLRPGRFDRRVHVPTPDIKGRQGILKVHTKKTPLASDVDLALIAQATPGFTGADLENLINEAALIAARKNASEITMAHCEAAKDKVLMGAERASMIMSEEDKKQTAYHEAGHALVGLLTKGCDPVHKVTIIPRGQALGVTIMLPSEDRLSISKEYARGMILYAMGGRAAEELIYGTFSSGASDDLNKATEIARRMVCNWGMSEVIGPVSIGKRDQEVFVGRGYGSSSEAFSEKVSETVDQEIHNLLKTSYKQALDLLSTNKDKLDAIAKSLLIKETLGSKELETILTGENIITDEQIEAYHKRVEAAKNWKKIGKDEVLPEEKKEPRTNQSEPSAAGI